MLDISILDDVKNETVFKALLKAYAKGILKTLGITPKQEANNNAGNNSDVLYRVQVGAFKDKTNAEKLLIALKEKGFIDAYIRQ